MGKIIAVANRKGGVGKSTISVMLAECLSMWAGLKVLVVDLDSQANASLVLVGGNTWIQSRDKSIAEYIERTYFANEIVDKIDVHEFIISEVGDVRDEGHLEPNISLIPGSLDLEDIEHEIFFNIAQHHNHMINAERAIIRRFKYLLSKFKSGFDVVVLDCPPGISFSTRAALSLADKVIVPFKPDYVSQYAFNVISRMVEGYVAFSDLLQIKHEDRRYVGIANFVRNRSFDERLINELSVDHPVLKTRIPFSQPIANAFDWSSERRTLHQKYKSDYSSIEKFFEEIGPLLQELEPLTADQSDIKPAA